MIKSYLFLGLLISLVIPASAQTDLGRIYNSVYLIRHDNSFGTSFLISVNQKNYLITAKHLFGKDTINRADASIALLKQTQWQQIPCKAFFHTDTIVDIAVMPIPEKIIDDTLHPLLFDFTIADNCFYLGYPFGMNFSIATSEFPQPFVRHGMIAGYATDTHYFYIDGWNNKGFSGGPVVVIRLDKNNKPVPAVIGITHGNVGKEDEVTGLMMATPAEKIIQILQQNNLL